MQREAFVRARRFLQHNRRAVLAARLCAVGQALLLVALLAVLGLLAELLVHQGRLPATAFQAPAPGEERLFDWLTGITGNPDTTTALMAQREGRGLGLLPLAWRTHDRWYGGLFHALAATFSWTWENLPCLAGLLLIALLVVLTHGLLTLAMHAAAAGAAVAAAARLRRVLYRQTYRLGSGAFRTLEASEALGLFTRHLEAIHEALHVSLTGLVREPLAFGLLLAFALAIEAGASGGWPWLTLAFILFAGLVWYVGTQLYAFLQGQQRENGQRLADQLAYLQESIQLMPLAQCYAMEAFNQARVERQLSRHGRLLLGRYRDQALYRQTLAFLTTLALAVLAAVAGWSILSGNLDLAATITLAAALGLLYIPARRGLAEQKVLDRGRRAAAAVFAFLDKAGALDQAAKGVTLSKLQHVLEFDRVSLQEPGTGRLLLKDVTLHIAAGHKVALVGADELERLALCYLVPRFLDPTAGEIRIDGHNLRDVVLRSLRSQMALVVQRSLVFNDTVANNVGCGEERYSLPQIIEAAKLAHAHQFIVNLPLGYETPIGELGHRLTPGEQYRIGLARAILRDPAIVVIEEPAQAVDEATQALVDDTLRRFLPGRTVLFLPHRQAVLRACDCIFLFQDNRVVAAGTHRELLNTNERYRQLQYREFHTAAEAASA